MQAIQNLGLATIAMAAGWIVDHIGYMWLEMFFLGWLAIAFTSVILLWMNDYNRRGCLNMTISQRAEWQILDNEEARKQESVAEPE